MKRLKKIREEIANSVGAGNIAGLEPQTPPVRRKPVLLRRKSLQPKK